MIRAQVISYSFPKQSLKFRNFSLQLRKKLWALVKLLNYRTEGGYLDDDRVLAFVEDKPQPQHFRFVFQFCEEDLELEVVQVGFDVGHQQHDVLR